MWHSDQSEGQVTQGSATGTGSTAIRVSGHGRRLGFTALVSGAAALAAVVAAPVSGSGPNFTAAQVQKGQGDYTQNCAGCHGANLQGGAGPTLMGAAFLTKWASGKPLSNLHQVIS